MKSVIAVGCLAFCERSHPSLVLGFATADVHPLARLVRHSCELELVRGLELVVVKRGGHDLLGGT